MPLGARGVTLVQDRSRTSLGIQRAGAGASAALWLQMLHFTLLALLPLLFIGISQEQGISVATRAKFSVQSSSAAAAPIAR